MGVSPGGPCPTLATLVTVCLGLVLSPLPTCSTLTLLHPELSYVGSSPSLKVNAPPVVSRETGVCFAFAMVMSEALC